MKAVSGDKMMNRAKGPIWHRKQKMLGIVPKKLRGLDKEATWGNSKSDGWIYGHGSFCMVTHGTPFVGSFKWMRKKKYKKIYKGRSQTVEPMQGLIKELFDLDRCWMRGDVNNRWLFAAMGVAVQIAQLKALRLGQSTWDIRQEVVGL